MSARTYGEKWHGHHPTPRPPRDIEVAMEAAGAAHDDFALGVAKAAYRRWLTEQGYRVTEQGTQRPDEAVQ